MKKSLFPFILLTCTTAATAAEPGTSYLKLSAGQSEADLALSDYGNLDDGSISSASMDKKDTSYSMSAGYYVSDNVSISAGYRDLGEVSINAESDGSGPVYAAGQVSASQEVDGLTLGLNLHMPVGKMWEITAGAGFFFFDTDSSLRDSTGPMSVTGADDSDRDTYLSLGASVNLGKHWNIGAEFIRHDINEVDVDIAAASLTYRFGGNTFNR